MSLPALPLPSLLAALALVISAPARAEWLASTQPSVAWRTVVAGDRYSYLDATLADEAVASDASAAAWALAQLARLAPADAPVLPIGADQAMPPLGASRTEDGSTVGRRSRASARLQPAESTLVRPGQAGTDGTFGMVRLDPAWIAVPGAMLALVSWRLQRKQRRDRRPAMLYVAR